MSKKLRLRNRISFLLVVVMVLYTFLPCMSYAQSVPSYTPPPNTKNLTYYYQGSILMDSEDDNGLMSSYLGKNVRTIIDTSSQSIVQTNSLISDGKNVIAQTDDTGTNINNTQQYTPYGVPISYSTSTKALNLKLKTSADILNILQNPYQYDDYYYDTESGLYYLNARYYSPILMQFISMDTYDLVNRYAYCNGNPIGNVDQSGHMSKICEDLLSILPFAGIILHKNKLQVGFGVVMTVFFIVSLYGSIGAYLGMRAGEEAGGIAGGIAGQMGGKEFGEISGKKFGAMGGEASGYFAAVGEPLSKEDIDKCGLSALMKSGKIAGRIAGKIGGGDTGKEVGEQIGKVAGEIAGRDAGRKAGRWAGFKAIFKLQNPSMAGKEAGKMAGGTAGKVAGEDEGWNLARKLGDEAGHVYGKKAGMEAGLNYLKIVDVYSENNDIPYSTLSEQQKDLVQNTYKNFSLRTQNIQKKLSPIFAKESNNKFRIIKADLNALYE